MKRATVICLFTFFLAMILSDFTNAQSTNPVKAVPDFAFPQSVTKQSEQELKIALEKSDDLAAIRAIMDYGLAQSAINSDNTVKTLSLIDSTLPRIKSPAAKSVLQLLKATIINDKYNSFRWKSDKRETPLFPIPADYNEWSGEQFRYVIAQTIDKALENQAALQNEPLSAYSLLITADKEQLTCYPTLFDFVAYTSIELLDDNINTLNTLPAKALVGWKEFISSDVKSPNSETVNRILSIYRELLKFHSQSEAPLITADLSRIRFIKGCIYYMADSDHEDAIGTILKQLYTDCSQSEYSGDILIALYNYYDIPTGNLKEVHRTISDFCERYPSFDRINCLKNIIDRLERKSIHVASIPQVVRPGEKFNVLIKAGNVVETEIKVYRHEFPDFPFVGQYAYSKILRNGKLVDRQTIHFGKNIPFETDTTATLCFTTPGCYFIVAEAPGLNTGPTHPISVITCTDIILGRRILGGTTNLFTVSSHNGRPMADASIMFRDYKKNAVTTKIGSTDKDGFFKFPYKKPGNSYAVLSESKSNNINIYLEYSRDRKWNYEAVVFTDLGIYHPGDSVKWCAVAYKSRDEERTVLGNEEITAVLKNANYMDIDTLHAVTDSFGRIEGKFHLPEGELTGRYSIQVSKKSTGEQLSTRYFTVSDYKMPECLLEITGVEMDSPAKGDATVRGKAMTYSGVALGDMPLSAVLKSAPIQWWRYGDDLSFYNSADTTQADGTFAITIRNDIFENSPYPHGLFTIELSGTSSTGESMETSRSFARSNPLTLNVGNIKYIDADKPVKITTTVSDYTGKAVSTKINLIIDPCSGETGTRMAFDSGEQTVDFGKFPSGTYNFSFVMESQPADTVTVRDVTIYRPDDKKSPDSSPLWMPYEPSETHSLTADNNRNLRLLYAVPENESYVLYTLSDGENIIEQKWIYCSKGMHYFDVRLPDDTKSVYASFCAIRNCRESEYCFRINEAASQKYIKLKAETFRNKIVPGTEETWTFKTVDRNGKGIETAMILDMYNKALGALKENIYSFPHMFISDDSPRFSFGRMSNNISFSSESNLKYLDCHSLLLPEFLLYGRSFSGFVSFGNMLYGTSVSRKSMTANVPRSNEDFAVIGAVAEPEEAEMSDVIEAADAGSINKTHTYCVTKIIANNTADAFEYRDSSTPLAFFRPMLTTDSNGDLSFSFRVPNANATWRFQALALTRDVLTDIYSAEVLANKPIMVQPNLPRFIRTGDVMDIKAAIQNNTDTTCGIKAVIEVFNPGSSQIISRRDTVVTVPAHSSSTVTTVINGIDAPFIGYRIKASSETFADGEQSVIPVLPSSTPVIETSPFYIPADTAAFSMKLPETGRDVVATLQYCDNPVWYAATALPGLRNEKISTPVQAADAIFSAAVARGLLKDNPIIAEALDYWQNKEASDSTLVSMLERNSELKTMLLQATPWMLDAASDTERMQRLALVFDKSEINRTIGNAVAMLKKLQRDNGGFAWINQIEEPSMWATLSALEILGRLNQLGYMPADKELDRLVGQALKWFEQETIARYRKYPRDSYYDYLLVTDLYPEFKPSATGKSIKAKEIQLIVRNWTNYSVGMKAQSAFHLYRNNYRSLSATVLKSIRQYAECTPAKGMWWPSVQDTYGGSLFQLQISANVLMAMQLIDPASPDIDRIRQWLILQKEAQNWGNSAVATNVITSILTTSPKWVEKAGGFAISVAGNRIDTSGATEYLGYLKTDISDIYRPGAELEISKQLKSPAWGAVYRRFTSRMDEVKAYSTDDLSIEKQMFVNTSADKWAEASDLKVGDKVKIRLLIHCNRNIQYVAIDDDRASCLEPVEQLPQPVYSEGLCFYRENRDASTNLFISNMPKGTYMLEYEMWVNNSGKFTSGIATIQSQYAPEISAHSSGSVFEVK